MIVLLTYDISDNRTRARFHRYLREYGINSQKSVFECLLDPEGIKAVVSTAAQVIDPKTDSVRLYRICSRCMNRVMVSGLGIRITQLDYMIV
jgi:CRISPR-associated protein Cas2